MFDRHNIEKNKADRLDFYFFLKSIFHIPEHINDKYTKTLTHLLFDLLNVLQAYTL